MRIVIVSDVHSNFAALRALPEENFDELWCLGDLVDYGPEPKEVIHWIRENATLCVRGNHDHAVGFDVDPQCSPSFQKLAVSTRHFTQQVVVHADVEYLRSLSIQLEVQAGGAAFYLVHAIPTDPLFGYCSAESDRWVEETFWVNESDILVVGHTHTPFVRRVGRTTIVNPGSVGQPKTGRPFACYALWEDGEISLKEYAYPIEAAIREIRAMSVSKEDQDALISVLETGRLPTLCGWKSQQSGEELRV